MISNSRSSSNVRPGRSDKASSSIRRARRDVARLGRANLYDGRDQGGEKPALASSKLKWSPISRVTGPAPPRSTNVCRSMSCRAGWYVIDDEPSTLFAMGIHGQKSVCRPDQSPAGDRKTVVARHSVDLPAWTLTHRALAELRRCLLEQN
jgi:hypothetical protein